MLKLAAILIGCAAAMIGVAMLALPGLVESSAFQTALHAHAAEALGVPLEWQRLEANWFPPRLTIYRPRLDSAFDTHERIHLRSETATLRFALWPVLSRRVVVERIALLDATLEAQRIPDQPRALPVRRIQAIDFEATRNSADGDFSIQFTGRLPSNVDTIADASIAGRGRLMSIRPDVAELHLTELDLRWPALTLTGSLDLRVRPSPNGSTAFEAKIDLGVRGSAAGHGKRGASGAFDTQVELAAFDLAIIQPLFSQSAIAVSGLATGTIRLVGKPAGLDLVTAELLVTSGILETSDYRVEGIFPARLQIANLLSRRPSGRIVLDLTKAHVDYQGQFEKRIGTPAEITTDFAPDESGEMVLGSRFKLRSLNEVISPGVLSP